MSVEIPSALIRRFQATLRKNAGVPSSYDPADPSLPSLSSLHDAALASLDADPSLSYLRCTRCRRAAGLVRGPNSTLCILCGRDRSDDGPAQSLSFNYTVACKKLLESLQLDGSEVIDIDTESKDSNKGQDTQDNGLVLSSVLDLELKWPPEKEAAVNRSSDKAPESSQAVNLSGFDLATFFSDSRNKIFSAAPSVTTEELMPCKQTISTKSHVSSGPDSFASFKDLPTPNVALSSESTKGGGDFAYSFADWEAGFQSGSSQAMQLASESIDHYHGSSTAEPASLATNVAVSAESKSVDLFEGSTTEVSSHAASAPTFSEHTNADHEINNEGNSGESTNEWGQFSSRGNWMQDDLWGNPPDQLKNTSKTDDNRLKDNVQCTTSIGESWGQDEMWATSSMKASNIKSKRDDDDDDDAFDDALDEDAFDDASDIWQDFASSKEAPGVSSNTWIQSGNEIAPNEHASVLNVDLPDIEFGNSLQTQSYSSSGAQGEQGADKVNGILLNTSASTGNIDEFFNVKSINGNCLEAWQDITSSNGASGDLSNLWTQSTTLSTLNEHASGAKSVNSQEMEFGSFLDSDSVSGALGDQKDPSEASAINLDASVPDNNTNEFDKTKQRDNSDDSLNDWQEFTSSKEALGGLPNSWTSGTEAMSMENDPGVKPVDPQVQEFDSFLYSNFFSGVDGQKSSSHANDIQLDALFSSSSTGFKSGGQEDPSDASAIKLDAPVSSNIVTEFDKTKQSDDNDDSLDDWQDFTSSKEASGVSPNSWASGAEATLMEHALEMKQVDPRDSEFGSFAFSDSFSRVDGPRNSTRVNDIQLDVLVSNSSTGFKSGGQKDPSDASAIKLDAPVSSNIVTEFDKTKQSDDNDDSLDDWQDFTSSKDASGVSPNSWASGAEATLMEHALETKQVDPRDSEFGSFAFSDSFSRVDGPRKSTRVNDIQLDVLVSNSSTGFKSGGQKDPSDASAIKLDALVSSNIVTEFDKTKQSDDNDDSLDDWQDFTSSKEASGVSPNSWASDAEATSMEHALETKQVDPRDSEFGSFVFSDSFSLVDGPRSSTRVNDIQLDVLVSNSSTRFKSGGQKDPSDSSAIKLDAPVSSNIVNEFDKTKQSGDNYDSLDDWQDFTGSKEASGVLPNSWASGTEATSMEHAPGTKQVDTQDSEFGSFVFSDSFSGMDGQIGSTRANDIQLDALVSNSSTEFKSGGQKDPKEAITIKIDAPVSSNSRNEFDKTKQSDDNDDFLDFWQDFTGSKEASGVLSNSRTSDVEAISIKHAPGMKPVDPKDSEFGSFLYPGSFSGVDGQKVSTRVNDIQLGALFSNSSMGFDRCGQKDPSEASAIKLVAPVSSNSVNEFDKTKQNDDSDDSLDDWQDFISSEEASGVLPNSWASVAEATSMEHALGSNQVDPQDSEFGSFVFSDSFSGVDGQRCSTHVNDIQLGTFASNSGTGFRNDKNMTDNGGLFGSWKDFTSLNEVPEGLSNLSRQAGTKTTSHEHTAGTKSVDLEDMEFGDFLQSDMFSGMSHQGDFTKANDVQLEIVVSTPSTKEFNNTRDMNDNFDPFKAGQEFTSSSDAQGSLASLSTQPDTTRAVSYEHASGTKSLDLQDMGFGSFLHSNSLLGALGDVKSSSAVNGMQDTSISYRMNGTDEKVAAASSIPGAVDAHESNIPVSNFGRTNSKVDMLLAQMSDLSFMLDDNISIPKKVDSSDLKS